MNAEASGDDRFRTARPVLETLPFVAGLDPDAQGVLAREARAIHVVAGDVVFLQGDASDGLYVAEERPRLLWPLMRNLARRLMDVVEMVEDLSLLPLEARTATFLRQHADTDVFERRAWATQAELSARLGTVEDVLQRTLHTLAAAVLIAVQRQRIVILDRAGLEARAGG